MGQKQPESLITHSFTMKFFAIFALIGAAAAMPSCDECKKAVGDLQVRLTSADSIAEQMTLLVLGGCVGDFDIPECEAAVSTYWPEVGPLTFNYFFTEKEPCGEMGMDV